MTEQTQRRKTGCVRPQISYTAQLPLITTQYSCCSAQHSTAPPGGAPTARTLLRYFYNEHVFCVFSFVYLDTFCSDNVRDCRRTLPVREPRGRAATQSATAVAKNDALNLLHAVESAEIQNYFGNNELTSVLTSEASNANTLYLLPVTIFIPA